MSRFSPAAVAQKKNDRSERRFVVRYSLVLMLARRMTQNFRFSRQAKDRSCGVVAVLGVCIGACLPIAIGWNGQSHSGYWQLAWAEDTMALDGLKTIPSHFGTKETIDPLDAA